MSQMRSTRGGGHDDVQGIEPENLQDHPDEDREQDQPEMTANGGPPKRADASVGTRPSMAGLSREGSEALISRARFAAAGWHARPSRRQSSLQYTPLGVGSIMSCGRIELR
jgi:hypothetical protein